MAKQKQAKKQPARAEKKSEEGIKVITVNRQAYHDYTVERTIEAGISLVGTEIKSIRDGKVNLRSSYAIIRQGEVWLENAHIATYAKTVSDAKSSVKDLATLKAAIPAIGKSCGGCHETFRIKKS